MITKRSYGSITPRRKHFNFDVRKAIETAWDVLWASNLRRRKEDAAYEKKVGKKPYGWARSYYICAVDVERLVRDFAEDTANGKPWRTTPGYGGYGSGIRMPGNLQRTVRDWLLHNSNITGHNFGRGHISGMRFRPRGEPMAEAEVKTMVKHQQQKDKPRPLHYQLGNGRLLCMANRKRSLFSRHRAAWSTTKEANVTCPRCLKSLKSIPAEAKADAKPDVAAAM